MAEPLEELCVGGLTVGRQDGRVQNVVDDAGVTVVDDDDDVVDAVVGALDSVTDDDLGLTAASSLS